MADIKYLDKTGLGTVKSILEGLFAPNSHKHTVADISNFPSSLPASDVYSWAKAETKPAYSFSEINAGNATIGDGANSIFLRTSSSWASSIYHHTSSDEAVVFLNKGKNVSGTSNYTTSWIFAYGTPADRPAWTSLTPALQIKGECVAINKLIGSQKGGSYNLDVNGSANAITLFENGVRVSTSRHTHTKSQITDFPTSLPANGGNADTVDNLHESSFYVQGRGTVNAQVDLQTIPKDTSGGWSVTCAGWTGMVAVLGQGHYSSNRGIGFLFKGGQSSRINLLTQVDNTWGDRGVIAYTSDIPTSLPANGGNADYATTAGSATNATNDSDGNSINSTYLKKSGGTMTGAITFTDTATAMIKYGAWTKTGLGSYPLPSLGSAGIGIFARPSKSTDEGGLIVTEDTCMIFNSADQGWSFQVHNTDLSQKNFSGTDGAGEVSRVFGIQDTDSYAWSRGGYKKEGSSNSYILLGGGGHKAISDFATSGHDHSGSYYDATISRTKNTVLAAPNGSNGVAAFRALVAADIPSKLGTTTIESSAWGSQLILNRTSSSGSWGPSIFFNYDGTCNGSLTMTSNKLYVGDNGNSRTEVSLVGHTHGYWTWDENTIKDVKVNNAGYADSAGNSTVSGDSTMTIIPQYNNEINFGGTNASSTLYIGYRAAGSKPIPTAFIFGGSDGSATLTSSGFKKKNSSDSYVLLGGGGHKAISDFLTSLPSHNHDDRYYTESEIDTKLAGKSDTTHTHNYLPTTSSMLKGYGGSLAGYHGENGWHRIAEVNAGNYGYGSYLLYLCGSWNHSANTTAILAIDTTHTNARITQLSGYLGFINKIRLVNISSNKYYIDIHINYSDNPNHASDTPGSVYYYFLTNANVTVTTAVTKITETVTASVEITLKDGGFANYATSAGSAPASDVYSWAKAASKPLYNFDEIGAGVATIGDGSNRIMFRTNNSYKNGIYYSTPGNEALVFGTVNPVTSWIFATTDPASQTAWTSLTPSLQIKNGKVAINKLIASGVEATYNLEVNGNINASNGFFDTSDERLKDFYDDIDVDFDKLKAIPKKYFSWKNDENKEIHLGTSAQEIQKVYPEIVNESADGELSVDYSKLSVVALAAVDKLYDKINKIEQALIDKGIL